jgi:Kef-type K+ transport system membrane component KefB
MGSDQALSMLVIALGAFAVPLVSGRFGVPAAVGEILFGVAVGPAVLGLLVPSPFTAFLAEFGFAFLMFLAGLELDFTRIERQGARGVLRALAVAVLVNVAALLLTLALGLPPFLFVAFGAVSVGILLVTLAETGRRRTAAGQALILAGSVGEFLTIVLLTGFAFYHRYGLGGRLVGEMAKLLLILVVAYLALVVLRTLIWWFPRRFARLVATHDPSEVGVRAGMAMMLVFVALASLMGIKSILGAFVAGALFSAVFREKGILETKLSSVGFGFFVPIFFISVGAGFALDAVARVSVLVTLALFAGLSVVAKAVGALPLALAPFGRRDGVGAALLLSTPLTLLVVIARIGSEARLISPTDAGALVLLAMVSSVAFPMVYRWLYR